MGKKRAINWILIGVLAFIVYIFAASAPIGSETVIVPAWLRLLSTSKVKEGSLEPLIPFSLGQEFGYFDAAGDFSVLRSSTQRFTISDFAWSEYAAIPEFIEAKTNRGELLLRSTERGYPFLADSRVFILSSEQNSIISLDSNGKSLWRRDFPSTITCADAAAGLLLVGLLDGSIELIDTRGNAVFTFEPGGSRLPVIVAARLSSDAQHIALVSGIDPQRFLLLDRSGSSYKVAYHEFLEKGFRRPVLAAFLDGDDTLVFETDGGLGVLRRGDKKSYFVPLLGEIRCIENEAKDGRLFLILARDGKRELVGLRLPNQVFMRAPYTSDEDFLERRENRLYLGGGDALVALDIKTR
ncbi:hypothetical protein MASR2M78_04950 [Treponema sp.]